MGYFKNKVKDVRMGVENSMMKLSMMKRIVDTVDDNWNSPFAEEIAKLWGYDERTLKFFRASANFLYIFQNKGQDYFLRFKSAEEKSEEKIKAEIKILNYLDKYLSNTVKAVKSLNNRYVETVETELGTYHAVVFERLQGKQYEIEELNLDQYYKWGKALGELHKNSNNIPTDITNRRNSWQNHIKFIDNNLPENETAAIKELKEIEQWLKGLEITEQNYGLIHFDFELDNLVWNDGKINILDFDDSANYWYVGDIAFALRDLFKNGVDLNNKYFKGFITGYESEHSLDRNILSDLSWFMKLHNLFTFTKLLRTIDISNSDKYPEWLLKLRRKLTGVVNDYRNSFGL